MFVLYYIATAYYVISFLQVNAASSDRLVGADLTVLAWNSLSKICQCARRAGHLPQRPLWQAWMKLKKLCSVSSGLDDK